jgi:RNA polymerase-binding transcription factor DksA
MKRLRIPAQVLEPVKSFLEKKREEYRLRLADLEAEDPFRVPDRELDYASPDTEAMDRFDHERVEAMRREVSKRMIEVEVTMQKIDSGAYGICENCGKMIDTDRLGVDPMTPYCVACSLQRDATK